MSETTDRQGRIRVPGPLYDRWLRRCHREGVDPDKAAAVWMERGLRRDLALMSEETPDTGKEKDDDEAEDQ